MRDRKGVTFNARIQIYAAQTQRAVENFPIRSQPMPFSCRLGVGIDK
ncbi:MAG TPA: hypothetical protein VM370_10205 [Candidatus Thermoplasmatota archaeon]|nr:hypothetical protein [Candidatus Thermoplasmatota archaeon]